MGDCDDMLWAVILMVAWYLIWQWRNKNIFEEGFVSPGNPSLCVPFQFIHSNRSNYIAGTFLLLMGRLMEILTLGDVVVVLFVMILGSVSTLVGAWRIMQSFGVSTK